MIVDAVPPLELRLARGATFRGHDRCWRLRECRGETSPSRRPQSLTGVEWRARDRGVNVPNTTSHTGELTP
jgi:hypothetical protein